MRPIRTVATAVLAAAALIVTGCANGSDDTPAAAPSSAATFPVTVGTVTLEKRPEKIVALSPSATEMLFAIGAGKQVTAVDDNSNYPAEAPKSDLSGFNPNAEAIAAKNPDLVVLSNDTNKVVDQLTKLKVPVYVAPAAKTLDDTYQQIADLGALTGHPDEAADLTTRMKNEIDKLVKDVPQRATKLRYYYELDPTFYSVTSKTLVGSLFALVGMENVADAADPDGAKGGYPQLSQEVLVKANPDLIFLADVKCCQQSPETVKARSGWAAMNAVKNNQIVTLDDDIASRWGPRVVDLVRAIVDAVAKVPAA
ncbi:iron complex transport system substrate-binding protein [Micromonospora pattaloongensis]|uniref:Iron complex transport system substrate-binding protein n=1 Tax=Micromonospora pattaloongensis TaxID=405436 RepID=A0A1H3SEM1_9ACTN|nr:ABC transporter substrate-binding protein [Micromonospora pattaloongensis]SDZ36523.1 iron complex transport system substrate-binding protein [Micromonospora pattaloongensis]